LVDEVKRAPGEVAEAAPPSSLRLAEAAGVVSGFTFLSRILGLVREQVFAALLGAGLYADAFLAAFRIPNLLRDLFAEGALSAAFVPTYARALTREGKEAAFRLASRLLTLLGVILGALVLLGMALAGPLVSLLAPGFESVPGKSEVTIELTRVMLPFLPLVSFAAVAMGMLNAHGRFGLPAFAPAAFNLVTICWALALWAFGFSLPQVALGWAVGTLLGGAAQLLVQLPSLRQLGWRPRPEWAPGDPGIRAVAGLMAPATLGLAAVQVNIFVSTIFASHEAGAVAWLQYAFRLLYLPIGIFGVAVGTVATADLARRAALEDREGIRATVARSLRLLAFLTLPATAGLIALGVPIVRLLFERGRFTTHDTNQTAAALALYAVGLVGYTGVKVLAPAFYAMGTPRVPLMASAAAVATNLVFIVGLHGSLGFRAIALGTALGSLVNALWLVAVFERRIGGLVREILSTATGKMAAVATAMAGVAWLCARALDGRFGGGWVDHLVTGLLPILAGVACYGLGTWALGVPEWRHVAALPGRLLRRKA